MSLGAKSKRTRGAMCIEVFFAGVEVDYACGVGIMDGRGFFL